ncbi:hypothetical protein GCM10010191_19100 [Actinomadura vinacea]|uniref:Na+/H+ antiporter MnhB subunit-related protein domain-containing protein n=1 Tax=Actinomadura vinacea TaxID=115336 RepID=A0ABN3IRG3_9ACTN
MSRRVRLILFLAGGAGLAVLFAVAALRLPRFGGAWHPYGELLLPVTLMTGVYIVAHGHLSPGGGFQGGVVLGSAIHLVYLSGDYPALARIRPIPVFENGEGLAAGAFVVLALWCAGQVEAMNAVVGLEVGCAVVLVLAKFFEQALLMRERA